MCVCTVGQGEGGSEMREGNGVGRYDRIALRNRKKLSEIEEKKMKNKHVSGGWGPKATNPNPHCALRGGREAGRQACSVQPVPSPADFRRLRLPGLACQRPV